MAQGTQPLSDVFRNNVLFQLRGGQNVPRATYSRASTAVYVNHSTVPVVAASGILRVEWADIDGAGVRETAGYLLEGARTQLVTDPENFAAWSQSGVVALVSGQTDPFGTTGAYSMDGTAGAAYVFQNVTFPAGTATRSMSVFLKSGGSTGRSRLWLRDMTAPADRLAIDATWSAGVPTLSLAAGGGTIYSPISMGNGWYWIAGSPTGVIGANTNELRVQPDQLSALLVYAFGANAWNAPFPSSYQGPSGGATVRPADSFTIPWNHSPQDMTVLARMARPHHADAGAATALGVSPGIFSIGAGAAARIGAYFDPAARNIISVIDTATTDATQTTASPAGNPTICMQYKNLTTGGLTALDVGSGLTAFSTAATAFSAFSSQTLRIGRYDDELSGNLIDLLIVRGLKSRQEMMLLAGII